MNVLWVKLTSWHIVKEQWTSRYRTRCGRVSETIPGERTPGERTCESCLRWLAKTIDTEV